MTPEKKQGGSRSASRSASRGVSPTGESEIMAPKTVAPRTAGGGVTPEKGARSASRGASPKGEEVDKVHPDPYRGTSLIKNTHPPRTTPRPLGIGVL